MAERVNIADLPADIKEKLRELDAELAEGTSNSCSVHCFDSNIK